MKADAQKITEARRSLEAKLGSLYKEYYDKIARYAFVRIGNRTDAEDIAGEVFLKALKSIESYEDRGIPMQAWLFTIAHNMTVDYLRKKSIRKTVDIDSVTVESGRSLEAIVETSVNIERVKKAMEQLSRQQREVLSLRFFGGMTSGEVGQILGKSDGAVREMQRAAIEKLRQLLS